MNSIIHKYPLVFVVALLIVIASPAFAVDRYVDVGGQCGGNDPCYMTIGLAVAASEAGDVIYVYPGVYAESVDLSTMATPGDITLITVDQSGTTSPGTAIIDPGATGGPGTGRGIRSGADFPGDVIIDGFNVTSPDADAINIDTAGGDIVIRNISAYNADIDGVDLESDTGTITISNTSANASGDHGFEISGTTGTVTVENSSASGNVDDGFNITVVGTVLISGCTADYNSGGSTDGFYITGDGDVTISESSATENGDDGFDVEESANLTMSDCSAESNGADGFELEAEEDMDVTRVTALYNGDDGIDVEASTTDIDNLTIRDSLIQQNGSVGVDLFADDLAVAGTHRVTGNIICDNLNSGMNLHGAPVAVTVNAEGNWWGDIAGPAHPDNLGGSGNRVIDSANGGAGTVDFTPWISIVTGSATVDPVNVGRLTEVSLQFSDDDGTVFLGEGPGDPNGEPIFTVTTDNGTLTGTSGTGASVEESITGANGTLTVTLTPDAMGTVTVTLVGPCALAGAFQIEAILNSLELFVQPNARTGDLTFAAGDTLVLEYEVRPSLAGFNDGRPLDALLAVQFAPGQVDQVIALPISGGPVMMFGPGLSGPTPLNPQSIVPTFSGFAFPPAPDPLTGTLTFAIPAGVNNNLAFLGTIVDAGTLNFLSGIEASNGFEIR